MKGSTFNGNIANGGVGGNGQYGGDGGTPGNGPGGVGCFAYDYCGSDHEQQHNRRLHRCVDDPASHGDPTITGAGGYDQRDLARSGSKCTIGAYEAVPAMAAAQPALPHATAPVSGMPAAVMPGGHVAAPTSAAATPLPQPMRH